MLLGGFKNYERERRAIISFNPLTLMDRGIDDQRV